MNTQPDGLPHEGSAIESWTFPTGIGVPSPAGAYAHATALNDMLYVTGQLPIDPNTDTLVVGGIVQHTEQVLSNLTRVLELCGSSLDFVVQARTFLRFEEDFGGYNETFRSWFPTRLPSRTTVVVGGFAVPDALIEIDFVAALHRSSGQPR
jgi:reactive intermediate/imine deaminase